MLGLRHSRVHGCGSCRRLNLGVLTRPLADLDFLELVYRAEDLHNLPGRPATESSVSN